MNERVELIFFSLDILLVNPVILIFSRSVQLSVRWSRIYRALCSSTSTAVFQMNYAHCQRSDSIYTFILYIYVIHSRYVHIYIYFAVTTPVAVLENRWRRFVVVMLTATVVVELEGCWTACWRTHKPFTPLEPTEQALVERAEPLARPVRPIHAVSKFAHLYTRSHRPTFIRMVLYIALYKYLNIYMSGQN